MARALRCVVAAAIIDEDELVVHLQRVARGVQRVHRKGRVMTILSSMGADVVLDEARPLLPVSVEVAPVTLKEIFLETIQRED